jgi:hypothetical protein
VAILVTLLTHAEKDLPVGAKVYVVKAVLESLKSTANFAHLAILVARNS